MKPLKDIGNLIKPDPRSLTQFEPYLAMSLTQRRELVREALIKFCKEWIYPEDAWEEIKDAAEKQIEGLIKGEGL